MEQNQWFAVRCCCTPKKVFGFLKLYGPFKARQTFITNYDGQKHSIKIRPIFIDKTKTGSVPPELAIYSDDKPIEFWRTIPGFLEVGE
jgi:hypothetical protein